MYSLDPITGNLGHKNAGHLLRRATFGPTQKNISDFSLLTADEAIDVLFQELDEPLPPIDPLTGEDWVSPKPGPDKTKLGPLAVPFMGTLTNTHNTHKKKTQTH